MRQTKAIARMEKNSSTQVRGHSAARSIARLGVALLMVLAVGACSLAKFGYRHGDTVGMFWIDRYLDLSGPQKDFVRPRLHALLVWHRTTQLPDYATFAQSLQQMTSQPITADAVASIGRQARRRVVTSVDHALPAMADLALQLTPDNVKAMSDRFAADDEKWRREFMDGDVESQQKARYEKTLERAEEWYGRFSDEQRDRIRALSDARPLDNTIVFGERQRRERDLVALLTDVLQNRPTHDAVVASMKAYADAFERNPDPQQRAFLVSLRQSTDAMDAAIHGVSTPEQRTRAAVKLQEWIDDFRSLSADPG